MDEWGKKDKGLMGPVGAEELGKLMGVTNFNIMK